MTRAEGDLAVTKDGLTFAITRLIISAMITDASTEPILERLARRAADLGITAPAILFLETAKPLAYFGAQFLWAAQPFLSALFPADDLRDAARLLENPAAVEALIARLESQPAPTRPRSG